MKCNKHVEVTEDYSQKCWKNHIIEPNPIDVFIHTWGSHDEESLDKVYNPKDITIEEPIEFDTEDTKTNDYPGYPNCTTINMFYSQAYSAKKSIEMKSLYEKENNFKYSMVMMSRMDCLWLRPVHFQMLDPKYFYISNWNQQRFGGGSLGMKSNRTTKQREERKILDYWFISNSENIDKFSNLYDYIPEWIEANKDTKMSNHKLKKDFLVKTDLWKHKKYKFFEHHDHNIQRYFYKFGDPAKKEFKHITAEETSK